MRDKLVFNTGAQNEPTEQWRSEVTRMLNDLGERVGDTADEIDEEIVEVAESVDDSFLEKSANLSDVNDPDASRQNIGIPNGVNDGDSLSWDPLNEEWLIAAGSTQTPPSTYTGTLTTSSSTGVISIALPAGTNSTRYEASLSLEVGVQSFSSTGYNTEVVTGYLEKDSGGLWSFQATSLNKPYPVWNPAVAPPVFNTIEQTATTGAVVKLGAVLGTLQPSVAGLSTSDVRFDLTMSTTSPGLLVLGRVVLTAQI